MIDKEKLIANWDDLEDETKTKILKLADKEIKEDYFVLKMGQGYYYYEYSCAKSKIGFSERAYSNSNFDIFNIETGNVFRTPEDAIFAGNCDYYTKRFETYVNRHTDKLDWTDITQEKYSFYYSCRDVIQFDKISWSNKTQGTVYASDIQILIDAIADIGEENFLKYVMKVGK